jgi:ubiquinone/menaquinone biosynthesis C-methylase UbiE
MNVKGFEDTIEWYNQNARSYAQSIENLASLEQIDEFARLLPKNANVLDAGCGGGRDTNLLKDRGVNATGIDLSHGLIDVARQKYPSINFVEGNFLNLPFEEKTFDGVWAHASLLHLETREDVESVLREFFRVLKQGGILHIFVKAQTGAEKTAVVTDTLSKHDRFFQYFTEDEISSLLRASGFKNIEIRQCEDPGGRPEVKWILSLSRKT